MIAKVLAGLLAAVLATGIGVSVAFLGGNSESAAGSAPSESLPVSEGCCCLKAVQASTCPKTDTDALAACAGGTSLGVTAAPPKLGCCDE
jgi:hypothetical protein